MKKFTHFSNFILRFLFILSVAQLTAAVRKELFEELDRRVDQQIQSKEKIPRKKNWMSKDRRKIIPRKKYLFCENFNDKIVNILEDKQARILFSSYFNIFSLKFSPNFFA